MVLICHTWQFRRIRWICFNKTQNCFCSEKKPPLRLNLLTFLFFPRLLEKKKAFHKLSVIGWFEDTHLVYTVGTERDHGFLRWGCKSLVDMETDFQILCQEDSSAQLDICCWPRRRNFEDKSTFKKENVKRKKDIEFPGQTFHHFLTQANSINKNAQGWFISKQD